jgi:putative FmdB family regulatory protein
MPLYEYKCKKCGHHFERIVKFSDKPMKKCPDCGKKMAAFKQGRGWKYLCANAGKHAEDKLKAKQKGPDQGKGGVKRGTPSPMLGKPRNKKYVTRYPWGTKTRPEDGRLGLTKHCRLTRMLWKRLRRIG